MHCCLALKHAEHNGDIWCERASKAEARLAEAEARADKDVIERNRVIAEKSVRLAEAEALLRDAQTYAIDIQGFVLESGYKAGAVECADRIDAHLAGKP
jgi:hypothetical protein